MLDRGDGSPTVSLGVNAAAPAASLSGPVEPLFTLKGDYYLVRDQNWQTVRQGTNVLAVRGDNKLVWMKSHFYPRAGDSETITVSATDEAGNRRVIAFGVVIGGLAQFLCMTPHLRREVIAKRKRNRRECPKGLCKPEKPRPGGNAGTGWNRAYGQTRCWRPWKTGSKEVSGSV